MNRQNVFLKHVDQLSEVAGKFTAIQVFFFPSLAFHSPQKIYDRL